MADDESAQMWQGFAERGIAIRTKVGAFANQPNIRSQVIERTPITGANWRKAGLIVTTGWH